MTSDECQQLKITLQIDAIWIVERETLSVRSTKCESFTTNIPQIYNKCIKLNTNKKLLNALDVVWWYFFVFYIIYTILQLK